MISLEITDRFLLHLTITINNKFIVVDFTSLLISITPFFTFVYICSPSYINDFSTFTPVFAEVSMKIMPLDLAKFSPSSCDTSLL